MKVTTNVTTKVEKEIDISQVGFFAEKANRFGINVVWAFIPNTDIKVRYVVDVMSENLSIISFSWENEQSKGLHIFLRENGLISKKKEKIPLLWRIFNPFYSTYSARAFTRKVW